MAPKAKRGVVRGRRSDAAPEEPQTSRPAAAVADDQLVGGDGVPGGLEDLDLSSDDADAGASLSGDSSDEGGGIEGDGGEEDDGELREALFDYATTAARLRGEEAAAARSGGGGSDDDADSDADGDDNGEGNGDGGDGGVRPGGGNGVERPIDPGSDSSEDERPNRNTVGAVPLKWYKDEEHIGYDLAGQKLTRRAHKDALDRLLDRNDHKSALRTIYDEYNDEEITLSKEELAMIMRIRKGQFPSVNINPFEEYNDYFSSKREVMPINDAPVPKRRFIPSKHEEKKVIKLVRAMRNGWIRKKAAPPEAPPAYLLWGDDNAADTSKTATGLAYIPAAKPKLPGHAESYNPPDEYLPTEEEKAGYELMDPEDRPKFVPTKYGSLRHVPMYAGFIKEVFERCLDLYLCPRVRKKRMHIDPESLVPQLPKPRDLQPFPTALAHRFLGHASKVRSVAPDASGQWLLSGGDDGTVRLWEVRTGRGMATWRLRQPVSCVAWRPAADGVARVVAACAGNRLVLLHAGVGGPDAAAASAELLDLGHGAERTGGDGSGEGEDSGSAEAPLAADAAKPEEGTLARWCQRPDGSVEIVHRFALKQVEWHARGDYFSTVAPTGNTQAVLVHQLSKRSTQNPFKKNRGRVSRVAFHPSKPFFFVATQNHVRVYNLAKQALAKKLVGGSGSITCLSVHPSGDHVIVGAEDKRLAWYDLDLSTKPYKALRYHNYAVRGCAFHRTYPLFASSSDDATVHVFHGTVYADLMSNPLIVPVKVLRGHDIVDYAGVLDVAFHPTQPWVFSAGADGTICLFYNL